MFFWPHSVKKCDKPRRNLCHRRAQLSRQFSATLSVTRIRVKPTFSPLTLLLGKRRMLKLRQGGQIERMSVLPPASCYVRRADRVPRTLLSGQSFRFPSPTHWAPPRCVWRRVFRLRRGVRSHGRGGWHRECVSAALSSSLLLGGVGLPGLCWQPHAPRPPTSPCCLSPLLHHHGLFSLSP